MILAKEKGVIDEMNKYLPPFYHMEFFSKQKKTRILKNRPLIFARLVATVTIFAGIGAFFIINTSRNLFGEYAIEYVSFLRPNSTFSKIKHNGGIYEERDSFDSGNAYNILDDGSTAKLTAHSKRRRSFSSSRNSTYAKQKTIRSSDIETSLKDRYSSGEISNHSTADGGWRPNDVVYGFVHIPKTAGTEINGELAMRYERVCGNKGSSYDFYQANERFQKLDSTKLQGNNEISDLLTEYSAKNNKRPYDRGKIPPNIITEVGHDDCDYVAVEQTAYFWPRNFGAWYRPLELHVPCRDPIDHLMSMCNFFNHPFQCIDGKIWKNNMKNPVERCLDFSTRFSIKDMSNSNINLKCFNSPSKFSKYLDYMGERLQKKELFNKYIHRDTNKPRDKENECIWKNKKYREKVKEYLLTESSYKDYYTFCESCMISENNLLM